MSSKLTERLRRNTALELTLRFALLFVCCASVLFVTVDVLLARAQLEKDQQLIGSFLESYQRLEQQAGLHKLELVAERDAPYFQRSAMRVELIDAGGKRLLLVQPDSWPARAVAPMVAPGQWLEQALPDSSERLLFGAVTLEKGARLSIAKSVAPRETALADNRRLVLAVMLPLLGLGLLLTAYMNWRALRPVRDLIDTVRALRATDLQARVPVRNAGSELGELAQLFNQMLSQIERLIVGMQHSLDAVAHDLRTPLARMRLSLESALVEQGATGMREALLDCAEESERIETLLRRLMEISEAESGILRLHRQPTDVDTLIADTVDLYAHVADEQGVEVVVEPGPAVTLDADPMRLRQVLGNLLDNAIKYSPAGSRVTIAWEQTEGEVLLRVSDQGIGISASDQQRVFDRLYRADKSRHQPGIGLGLSLVRAIVEAHQGSIALTSQLGQGTQLQVSLPKVAT